jgi:quercetin dioxygenase-like cupin family protein
MKKHMHSIRRKITNPYLVVLVVLILIFSGCKQNTPPVGQMEFPEGMVQHVVRADQVQWMACPDNLPEGCEIAVLEGNPKNPDLFTVRFRVSGHFVMPPHTHPKDERATILQGRAYVAFGADGTRESAEVFEPGDYYVNARGAIHSVWADSATIIQLTGIGPWEVDFIDN